MKKRSKITEYVTPQWVDDVGESECAETINVLATALHRLAECVEEELEVAGFAEVSRSPGLKRHKRALLEAMTRLERLKKSASWQ